MIEDDEDLCEVVATTLRRHPGDRDVRCARNADLASSTWDEFLLKPYCLPDLRAAIERRVARHAHR